MGASSKGASPGNLSLLFLIVKAVALVLFRSQDVELSFDKPRLIEKLSLKLYRQLCSESKLQYQIHPDNRHTYKYLQLVVDRQMNDWMDTTKHIISMLP